jgi:ribosomal protein L10
MPPEWPRPSKSSSRSKQKLELKGGVLDKALTRVSTISSLAKLPPAEVLKAQLLGLLNQPATRWSALSRRFRRDS